MSNGTGSNDESTRQGHGEAQVGGEDLATRLTRGVVDGFTEASQAFSHELEGSNRLPELMGRSVAGVIRANARLLDEVATVVHQAADEWGEQPRAAAVDLDYERLADLVAARLRATGPESDAAETGAPSGRSRKA